MKSILIVDDDIAVTNYLMVFLTQTGIFDSTVVNDSREVDGLLDTKTFDIILLDMDMPNVSGMDILHSMRKKKIGTPVVVLTGVSDVDLAVRAMKLGAFDYLTKPVDDEYLLEVLDNAIKQSVLHHSIERLPNILSRGDLTHEAAFEHLPTQNQGMIRLFHQAEKIASSDLSIFIWGESGTGKEALARAIHQASSRRDRAFVALEADSQDPDRFPAFFFGQARGWRDSRKEEPGLLEEADHGTLFLNNIDALSLPMQVRLKRVIQTGEYYRESSTRIRKADVRMIVSSTHDLTKPEYKDRFSRDLLYHLMVNSIKIPSLRDRIDDIPILAAHFLNEESERAGKSIRGFSDECMELLMSYSYPDNVQDLITIIAGAVANEETDVITVDSLSSYVRGRVAPEKVMAEEAFQPRKLDDIVKEHVVQTLEHFGQDKGKAARRLGITAEEIDQILKGE
jgi:DNA-binding NtrC family response regulator